MGALDPTSAAARLAAIIARCDAEQFTLTATTTQARFIPHPLGAVFVPRSTSVVQLTWSAIYRGAPWGDSLVCDSGVQALASAALVDYATQVLDLVDLRRRGSGYDGNYVPNESP